MKFKVSNSENGFLFGIVSDESTSILQYQIVQVKNVLFREAENVRHFENLNLFKKCFGSESKARAALHRFYLGGRIELPASPPLISFNPSDQYMKAFGTTNFDIFSIYIMNLSSLLALQEYEKAGYRLDKIKDNAEVVKDFVLKMRAHIVPQPVKLWRNKVAAHYAAANPKVDDNFISLIGSISPYVTYESGRYVVGGFKLFCGGKSTQFKKWSVTKCYEGLNEKIQLRQLPPLAIGCLVELGGGE